MNMEDRKADRETLLNHYESTISLPDHRAPGLESELDEYLSMPRNIIERLSPEACAEMSFRLMQFSFFMQRCLNRERANLTWAENELNSIVSGSVDQYDKYMKHDVKVACIIKENSVADELSRIIMEAKQRVDRLTYLSSATKGLSDSMTNVQRAKQYGGTQ